MGGGSARPRTHHYTRRPHTHRYTRPSYRPNPTPQEEEDRPTTSYPGPSRQPNPQDDEEDRPTSSYPGLSRQPNQMPQDDEEDRPTTQRQPDRTPQDDEEDSPTTQRQPNREPQQGAEDDILRGFFDMQPQVGSANDPLKRCRDRNSVAERPEYWAQNHFAYPDSPERVWPQCITSEHGFQELGEAMTRTRGFPKDGSYLDKAKFIYLQMELVAQMYGLEPGSGWPLSQYTIGWYRCFKNDPEGAESLKGPEGWGNCGEWSHAFSEILLGAHVPSVVVFADSSCEQGHSWTFWGNTTAVYVEERSEDGRISRRVFDPFNAAYHSPSGKPTRETLEEWGDLPLTDADRWQGESVSWLSDGTDKPCVKDEHTETVVDNPYPRIDPTTRTRPKVSHDPSKTGPYVRPTPFRGHESPPPP